MVRGEEGWWMVVDCGEGEWRGGEGGWRGSGGGVEGGVVVGHEAGGGRDGGGGRGREGEGGGGWGRGEEDVECG